ncbi:hypothetical protein QBC37DRAFT_399036 [Rhypophila decipiens]|uniref:Uncharacterized protein n=1 Tax=Rhypophila decipiens TaxID=261697 RepID=A0AAN7B9K6_9PEZI|nr:hypothetical protein QBC37DRAFT_399036 [Rhypophila decipiens]
MSDQDSNAVTPSGGARGLGEQPRINYDQTSDATITPTRANAREPRSSGKSKTRGSGNKKGAPRTPRTPRTPKNPKTPTSGRTATAVTPSKRGGAATAKDEWGVRGILAEQRHKGNTLHCLLEWAPSWHRVDQSHIGKEILADWAARKSLQAGEGSSSAGSSSSNDLYKTTIPEKDWPAFPLEKLVEQPSQQAVQSPAGGQSHSSTPSRHSGTPTTTPSRTGAEASASSSGPAATSTRRPNYVPITLAIREGERSDAANIFRREGWQSNDSMSRKTPRPGPPGPLKAADVVAWMNYFRQDIERELELRLFSTDGWKIDNDDAVFPADQLYAGDNFMICMDSGAAGSEGFVSTIRSVPGEGELELGIPPVCISVTLNTAGTFYLDNPTVQLVPNPLGALHIYDRKRLKKIADDIHTGQRGTPPPVGQLFDLLVEAVNLDIAQGRSTRARASPSALS